MGGWEKGGNVGGGVGWYNCFLEVFAECRGNVFSIYPNLIRNEIFL